MENGFDLYAQYTAWIWIVAIVVAGAMLALRRRRRPDFTLPPRRAGMVSIEPGAPRLGSVSARKSH